MEAHVEAHAKIGFETVANSSKEVLARTEVRVTEISQSVENARLKMAEMQGKLEGLATLAQAPALTAPIPTIPGVDPTLMNTVSENRASLRFLARQLGEVKGLQQRFAQFEPAFQRIKNELEVLVANAKNDITKDLTAGKIYARTESQNCADSWRAKKGSQVWNKNLPSWTKKMCKQNAKS